MASNTENLDLLMKNPSTDGADTFNVQTMLNENWQKIDNNAGTVAKTLANILKPTTPPIIGLPPSTTPDGMFRALGNTGELHVWRKTVVNSQAGYDIGEVEAGFLGSGQNTDNSNCGVTFKYSNSISVSDDGIVQQNSAMVQGPFSYNSSEPSTIQNLIRGKFVSMIATTNATFPSAVKGGVWYIPADANVSLITNGTSLGYPYNMCYIVDKMQEVQAYGTGTTTTYPVSTNPNAYQEGDDAKEAGYTLGEVVTGSFKLGINAASDAYMWKASSALTVTDTGVPSLLNPTNGRTGSGGDLYSESTIKSFMAGKFVQYVKRVSDATTPPDNVPPFNTTPSSIVYVPSDVVVLYSNGNYIIDRYQPVTGYAAVPAGTTIEYLGKLGDKARAQVLSYVGTGTYGSDHPNSLTFDFVPKMVIIRQEDDDDAKFDWIIGMTSVGVHWDGHYTCLVAINGKKLSFYNPADPFYQMNENGKKYFAIAIG